jgi:putative ATP-dependent endonuclease of the OLD family
LLSNKWRQAKTDTMLKFCRDIGGSELEGLELPQHISRVLTFLQTREKQ